MTDTIRSTRSIDRGDELKNILIDIFGSDRSVAFHAPDITRAVEHYMFARRVGLRTNAKLKNLQKTLKLCDDLLSSINENRLWMSVNIDVSGALALGTGEIVDGGSDCPLTEFRHLLSKSISEEPIYQGREKMYYKRRLWIWLAYIYEDATERRVTTSNNKDGTVSGDFVKYIIALSSLFKSLGIVTPDMVHQFVDWYRSASSERDREEVYLYRSLAKEARSAG